MSKLAIAAIAIMFAFSAPAFAKSGRGGGRTHYGGGHHTTSHGGHYSGARGSSHKGGSYRNGRTGNRYGRHK